MKLELFQVRLEFVQVGDYGNVTDITSIGSMLAHQGKDVPNNGCWRITMVPRGGSNFDENSFFEV